MVVQDIKSIVKGTANLQYIMSGGIAVYHLNAVDGHIYQIEIDPFIRRLLLQQSA